jgi:hypothetical protein
MKNTREEFREYSSFKSPVKSSVNTLLLCRVPCCSRRGSKDKNYLIARSWWAWQVTVLYLHDSFENAYASQVYPYSEFHGRAYDIVILKVSKDKSYWTWQFDVDEIYMWQFCIFVIGKIVVKTPTQVKFNFDILNLSKSTTTNKCRSII